MIKIINLIGARPQIIKAAAISRAIRNNYSNIIKDIVIHTGQHYDENMSGQFFTQLEIPQPSYNLSCGSASHAKQTAMIMERIEEVFVKERPDFLLVYGDTNSTLAASLVAIKMGIEVIHIEAGLRSYNKSMPEEVNRIVCDHVSTILFCPTLQAIENLKKEGFICQSENVSPDCPQIIHSGDIMYDNAIYYSKKAIKESTILTQLNLKDKDFVLFTLHRDMNTDNSIRLNSIFEAITEYLNDENNRIIFPIHPRTRKMIKELLEEGLYQKILTLKNLTITEPLSFYDFINLEANCKMILTDSGGVQKEAFFFKKPCVVLRPETEWIELVESGNAILADANKDLIIQSLKKFSDKKKFNYPNFYGNGNAADDICNIIVNRYNKKNELKKN
ncbi:MAG: UDP-N-acetylglucosamine 2-epimerase (non-hydrolyzing) [Bacteroidales bacterium]|nr:UDP-N-acetylglucosamine 2-epimerase (non-hydrolyzing) [Bacteroidales bacterium]